MNTPSPLVPQGSLLQQPKGNPNVRIAVFTIIAIHAVFFVGLLMQGCKRDDERAQGNGAATNTVASNYIPPLSDNRYYSNYNELVRPATAARATSAPVTSTTLPAASNTVTSTPLPPTPAVAVNTARTDVATGTVRNQITPDVSPMRQPDDAAPVIQREHKVVAGDSLYKVAKQYKVSLTALASANPAIDPKKLRPGQRLVLPAPEPAATNAIAAADLSGHWVKQGETLTAIAKQHGVPVKQLWDYNQLKTDRLMPGQRLKIPQTPHAAATSNRVVR